MKLALRHYATPWALICFVFGSGLLSSVVYGQLRPGQLPNTPAQPGQLGTKNSDKKNDAEKNTQQAAPVASGPTTESQESGLTIRETVQTVLVPTSVMDPQVHGYVNGLQASDFEVLDNDKPQRVQAEYTEQPMSVVLVVQGNSEIEPLLPKMRKSGILLHGLVTGADGDLAVLSFDHEMHYLVDFTNDPDRIDDAMQKLRAGSSTAAVIDAVSTADRMLRRHDPANKRRRVILLMSRNVDKGSQMRLDEAIRQVQFDNVIVYAINISKILTMLLKKEGYPRSPNGNIPPEGLPPVIGGTGPRSGTTDVQQGIGTNGFNIIPPAFRTIRDLFKKTPAEALTALTGGNEYNFATQRSLEEAVTDIGKDLNSQYILSYRPTDEVKAQPGYHTIRVLVNRPGLVIRTRVGYWWGGGKMQ
jgi:VWFA-related protein